MREPPGTQRPRRFYPRFHWELLVCGVRGHELIGTDAAHVGPEHRVFAREQDGVRWYRCVRCDSWLPLPPPGNPARAEPPPRDEIELPLRGKALRDKVVLRAIAIDRGGSAALVWTDQGRVLHGPTHITYGCNTSQQSAYAGANQGLSCKGPAQK